MRSIRQSCTAVDALISVFFFNDTATTEIYTLSLHDALPIFEVEAVDEARRQVVGRVRDGDERHRRRRAFRGRAADKDRKSTRLNSSHANISYAVFCLKKKNIDNRLPSRDEVHRLDGD